MQYREAVMKKFDVDFKNCVYDTIQAHCHRVETMLPKEAPFAELGPKVGSVTTDRLRDMVSPVLVEDDHSGIPRWCHLRFILVPEAFDGPDGWEPGMDIKTHCEDIDPVQLKYIVNNLQDTSIDGLFKATLHRSSSTLWNMLLTMPTLPHGLRPDLHLGTFPPNSVLCDFSFDPDGNLFCDNSDLLDVGFRLYVCSDRNEPFEYLISNEIPVFPEHVD